MQHLLTRTRWVDAGGFGGRSLLHSTEFLRLSSDLPVLVEIVDTTDKSEALMPTIGGIVTEGLATIKKGRIRFYCDGEEEEPVIESDSQEVPQ